MYDDVVRWEDAFAVWAERFELDGGRLGSADVISRPRMELANDAMDGLLAYTQITSNFMPAMSATEQFKNPLIVDRLARQKPFPFLSRNGDLLRGRLR